MHSLSPTYMYFFLWFYSPFILTAWPVYSHPHSLTPPVFPPSLIGLSPFHTHCHYLSHSFPTTVYSISFTLSLTPLIHPLQFVTLSHLLSLTLSLSLLCSSPDLTSRRSLTLSLPLYVRIALELTLLTLISPLNTLSPSHPHTLTTPHLTRTHPHTFYSTHTRASSTTTTRVRTTTRETGWLTSSTAGAAGSTGQ